MNVHLKDMKSISKIHNPNPNTLERLEFVLPVRQGNDRWEMDTSGYFIVINEI